MDRKVVDKLIKNNIDKLTRQQVKTLRGQLNKGETLAAHKGLNKLLNRGRKYNE